MIRGFQALALASVLAGFLGGGAGAGLYSPPPGDSRPVWSPDGSVLVYVSLRAPRGLHVLRPDGVEEGTLPGVPEWAQFAFSPGWRYIAYTVAIPSGWGTALVVSRPDGSERRVVTEGSDSSPTWSPDGRRIAFSRNRDPRGTSVADAYTIERDGSGLRRVAENAYGPVYSPDGTRIVYVTGQPQPERWDVAVVPAEGGTRVVVTAGLADRVHLQPEWSPDGSRIAFVGRGYLGVIRADGSEFRRYAPASAFDSFEWAPDGRSIIYSGIGISRLDLASGRSTTLAPFGSQAAISPNGAAIAFAGGGECKDRTGIYTIPATGGAPVRLTNDCRIVGTGGSDELRGTELADVLLGLDGDDVLTANDGAYVGDDLYGGAGDDVLNGDFRIDLLDGGPGADRLFGHANVDTLRGGPGRDTIAGAGGKDVLFAEDGERDVVSCGTNRPGNGRDLDTAFVDRVDRVAADCELLYRGGRADLRRGTTRLTISIRSTLRPREQPRRWTLRCNPAGGTLPRAAAACRRLATMRGPLAPIAPATRCAPLAGVSALRAQVEGRFAGKPVLVLFSRYSHCDVARWARHRFLFPGS